MAQSTAWLLTTIPWVLSTASGDSAWNASADGLMNTTWAQRGAFAQFAPLSSHPSVVYGAHERLGCESTALAQIMFFHKICPSGSVSYTAKNFPTTAMDFDKEASQNGLCEWSRFAGSPPHEATDPHMIAVARYEYAAAMVVEKEWGTGSYMLSHEGCRSAAAKHYKADISILNGTHSEEEHLNAISEDIDHSQPLKLHIRNTAHTAYHHVVVDGYRRENSKFMVHLNIGHSGYDNDWYDYASPICLKHNPDGSTPSGGGCAHLYDDISYRELWRIHPKTTSIILM